MDPSETQPLLVLAPYSPHVRAGTPRFYAASHDNDLKTPCCTRNVLGTSPQNEKPCSDDGKSSINSTWNNLQIRSISPSNEPGPRKTAVVVGFTTMLLSLAAIWFLTAGNGWFCHAFSPNAPEVTQFAPPEIQNSWGSYTPYFSVESYTPPPSNCHISQVRFEGFTLHLPLC